MVRCPAGDDYCIHQKNTKNKFYYKGCGDRNYWKLGHTNKGELETYACNSHLCNSTPASRTIGLTNILLFIFHLQLITR